MNFVFRDHYDWVVIGDDPAALLSGCLAAKLGLSVLMIPHSPGAKARRIGSLMCLDPESGWLASLGSSADGLLLSLMNRLEWTPGERDLCVQDPVAFQVLTPEHRFRLFREPSLLSSEFKRVLGHEAFSKTQIDRAFELAHSTLLEFWRALPSRLTLSPLAEGHGELQRTKGRPDRKEQARVEDVAEAFKGLARMSAAGAQWFGTRKQVSDLGREMKNLSLDPLFLGIFRAAHGGTEKDPTLAELAHFGSMARSSGRVKGGMTAWRELLVRLARRLGAHCPDGTELRRVFVQGQRLSGVQISTRGNMLSTGGAALGCSTSSIRPLLATAGKTLTRRLQEDTPPSGWKFTLALRIRKEGIPTGASRRMVWQERRAPALEIEFALPSEYGVRESEHELVFLRAELPYELETLKPQYQRVMAGRMLRQFLEICPFSEFHIAEMYPDFREPPEEPLPPGETQDPSDGEAIHLDSFAESYGYASLEDIPQNLRCYEVHSLGTRSGVEGLFVVSNESFPGLGALGGTVAALESVAWIAHRCGLDGPLF